MAWSGEIKETQYEVIKEETMCQSYTARSLNTRSKQKNLIVKYAHFFLDVE